MSKYFCASSSEPPIDFKILLIDSSYLSFCAINFVSEDLENVITLSLKSFTCSSLCFINM